MDRCVACRTSPAQQYKGVARSRGGHSGTEGVAPALRISRKKGSFLRPPHVRDLQKKGTFLYPGTKYGGCPVGENPLTVHTIHEISAAPTPSQN